MIELLLKIMEGGLVRYPTWTFDDFTILISIPDKGLTFSSFVPVEKEAIATISNFRSCTVPVWATFVIVGCAILVMELELILCLIIDDPIGFIFVLGEGCCAIIFYDR